MPKTAPPPAQNNGAVSWAQNARIIASAEQYYRIMYYGGATSWNVRDTHMFETLGRLLEARQGCQGSGVGAQLAYR